MINSCKNDHSMEGGNAHTTPWSQSQYHQPICKMRNGTCIKYMVQKMLFCFTNISAEILQHSSRPQLFHWTPYFGVLLHNAVAYKKICAINVGEIDPWLDKAVLSAGKVVHLRVLNYFQNTLFSSKLWMTL